MPTSITPSTSKITGLLSYISDVEKLEVEKIASDFLFKGNLEIIENQLGNILLYPQTIPTNKKESDFDLAIVKEILRLEPKNFYSSNLKRVYIPDIFIQIFPNLTKLVFIFIDILKPANMTSFLLKSENLGAKNLGTYIKPENALEHCFLDINIAQQKYHVPAGNITIIPMRQQKVDIKLESNCNIIEGRNEFTAEVIGGEIGLIIDLCQSK